MTKIQKQKHISEIKALILSKGFETNHWGKYHKGEIKIDVGDNNLKVFKSNIKFFSKPMTSLTIEEIAKQIDRWTTMKWTKTEEVIT